MSYGYSNYSYPNINSLLYGNNANMNQIQSTYNVSADSLLGTSLLGNQSQLYSNPFSLSASTGFAGTQNANMGDLMSIVQYLLVGLFQMFGQTGNASTNNQVANGNGVVNNGADSQIADLQKQLTDAETAATKTQTDLDKANAKKKETASQLATANTDAGKTQSALNSAQNAQKSAKTKADKAKTLKTNVHTMTDEYLKGNWGSAKYQASVKIVTNGTADAAPAEYHQAYQDWLGAANRYFNAVNSDTITPNQLAAKKRALETASNKLQGLADKYASDTSGALTTANKKLTTAQTNDKNGDKKVTDLKKADANAALAADQEADKKVAELKKALADAQVGVQNT
jgi:hypothetical protein